MTTKESLKSLFDTQKSELINKLSGLSLPNDCDKVKNIVSDYFNTLFDKEGDFRMTLTQSEDYILSAALSLLNAQQEIANSLLESHASTKDPLYHNPTKARINDTKEIKNPFHKDNVNAPLTLLGAGGGATLGHVFLGGWGAVFGAIAGTAIALYMSSKNEPKEASPLVFDLNDKNEITNNLTSTLDVEHFVNIIQKICESVDNLIATFRAQIKRVVDKYESQEKATFEKDFSSVLESIQSIVGYERAHKNEEKFVKKISERIEDLAECLENYNLIFVDYSSDTEVYFTMLPAINATEVKQVYPAIIKGGSVVLRGKVFVPEFTEKK